MIEEFNNWKDYNETIKGIVADEFNSLDLWYDNNTTAEIFNEAEITPTSFIPRTMWFN
jgi:hypothetical protein